MSLPVPSSSFYLLPHKPPPKGRGFKQPFISISHVSGLSREAFPLGLSCDGLQVAGAAVISRLNQPCLCQASRPRWQEQLEDTSTHSCYGATWAPSQHGGLTAVDFLHHSRFLQIMCFQSPRQKAAKLSVAWPRSYTVLLPLTLVLKRASPDSVLERLPQGMNSARQVQGREVGWGCILGELATRVFLLCSWGWSGTTPARGGAVEGGWWRLPISPASRQSRSRMTMTATLLTNVNDTLRHSENMWNNQPRNLSPYPDSLPLAVCLWASPQTSLGTIVSSIFLFKKKKNYLFGCVGS